MADTTPNGYEQPEAENGLNGQELPIVEHAQEIKDTAREKDSFIVVGETGSGKTTQIPLMLREIIGPEDKIAITQPRRVAARSVARYVSEQVGCRIGEEVGYTVRFEDITTEGTQVNFMTGGILLRKMQNDPMLREYSVVMVDEVHERSLDIDLTLGLLKKAQAARAEAGLEPLKIVVASATLEKEKLAKYFDDSPVVEVPGRLHTVDVHYEDRDLYDYTQAAAERVGAIVDSGKEGDILIFMPGAVEIGKTIAQVERLGLEDTVILPLHGQLSAEEQDRIFDQSDPRRKIIVSTNIAETSVTVPGVRHVIDSGLINQMEFDPQTGIESLVTRRHAKSGCVQRGGRAGRVAPGDCYRLYTEADFNERPDFQTPEIQRLNLARVVLTMKNIGIDEVESFDFIDPPDKAALTQAVNTLRTLGAINELGKLTDVGKVMAELPLDPHIARMVIEAEKYGCVEQLCTIAAFLGGRSVFVRPRDKAPEADAAHQKFRAESSDFLTFLNVWKQHEANRFDYNWARDNFLNAKALAEVRDVRYQLFRALSRNGIRAVENEDPEAIGKSIAAGLVENLLQYNSRHSYRRIRDDETGIYIHPSSVTFGGDPRYIVPAEIVQTSKTFARVCQVVKPEWIRGIAPQLVREEVRGASYDPSTDQVLQSFDLYLKGSYNSYLSEQREIKGEAAVSVFAQALASGDIDLPFVTHNKGVLAQLKDLYIRSAGETEQPLSTEQLAEIYRGRLQSIGSRKGLEAALAAGTLDLTLKLDEYMPAEVREQITSSNPDTVRIGDVAYRVAYADRGYGTDRFSARIRVPAAQIFSLSDMPSIPSGKAITIEVIDKEGGMYSQFQGRDLDELKTKSKDFLARQQWDNWRYTQPSEILQQRLANFDPASESPTLPERLPYGTDPQTGEPLYAYPAVTVESSYYSGNTYYVGYYATEKEALEAQTRFEKVKTQALEKQRIEQERLELLPQVIAQHRGVQSALDAITYDTYESAGLTYYEWDRLKEQLRQATYGMESNPRNAQETLQQIQQRITEAAERKREQEQQVAQEAQALREQEETGEVLTNFGGHFRVMGSTGQREYWVIQPDGTTREPDQVDYRKRYSSEGEKLWQVVQPDELAITWSKGSTGSDHEFSVAKLPVGELTPEQLETVRRLQQGIEQNWEGRRSMSGVESPPVGQGWGLGSVERSTESGLSQEELDNSPFADAILRARVTPPSAANADRRAEQQDLAQTTPRAPSNERRFEQPAVPTALLAGIQARDTASLLEEVETLMQRNTKPRKRALIQATLIDRGPEEMAAAKISEAEFPVIFEQLRQARLEAERGYDDTTEQGLRTTLRGVENMYSALKASRSELAREYIGESPEEVQRFQRIFISLVQDRERAPRDNELPGLVEQAVDQMTS